MLRIKGPKRISLYTKGILLSLIFLLFTSTNAQASWWKDIYYKIDSTVYDMRSYLLITPAEASDDDIKYMLRYNDYTTYLQGIQTVLHEIKFGQQVQSFIAGTGGCTAPSEEQKWYEILDAPEIANRLELFSEALDIWLELSGYQTVKAAVDFLLLLNDSRGNYLKAASAITCFSKRSLMFEYIGNRNQGLTKEAAYDDLKNTYGPIIDLLKSVNNLNDENLINYFEASYHAHSMWADIASRTQVGDSFGEIARQLKANSLPLIATPLVLSAGPYIAGSTITAQFSLTNTGENPITLKTITAGGRYLSNGKEVCPYGICPDLTKYANVSIGAGETYNYTGTIIPSYSGTYHFFPAFETLESVWNVTIQTSDDSENTIDIFVADQTPPAEVSSFQTTPINYSQIELSWINPPDIDFKKILIVRSESAITWHPSNGVIYSGQVATGVNEVFNSFQTSCIDYNLVSGTTYYYMAFSYDEILNYSEGVSILATTDTLPSATDTQVGNFRATTTYSSAALNWDAPTNTNYRNYLLVRGDWTPSSDVSYIVGENGIIYKGNATSFSNSGLSMGSTYHYAIFAYYQYTVWNEELQRNETHIEYGNGRILDASTKLGGNLTWNLTLSTAGNPHIVTSMLTVAEGVTLTILPGTIIKFSGGSSGIRVNGTLLADGTSSDQIYFTSKDDHSIGGGTGDGVPGSQDWDGIYFMPTSTGSVMDYCVVKYAGWENTASQKEAGIYCEGSSPTISHCEIKWNRTYGILLVNASPTIEGNTITGHYYGLLLSGTDSAPTIVNNNFLNNDRAIDLGGVVPATISGNTVTGSSGDNAGIYVHGTLAADATLVSNAGMPYVFNQVSVSAGKTLTIQPGTIIKFESSNSKLTVNGTLIAQGTPDQRIIFTSYKDDSHGGDTNSDGSTTTPGQQNWDGIYFMPTSTGSVMDYCVVKYAGWESGTAQKEAGIYCEGSSPTISNCEIKWNRMYGILLVNASPVIEGNTITGHYYGLLLSGTDSAPTIINNSFLNNDRAIDLGGVVPVTISGNTVTGSIGDTAGIYVHGTLAADTTLVSNAGMPYVFHQVTVSAGKTLTIQPGTIIKFESSNSKLTVNGTLIAQGTPDQRIIFTSYKDDSHGGDTNSDGSTTTPGQQNWDGIYFMPTSTGSVMDYCVVKYAGWESGTAQKEAGIYCEGSSPTISNCEIKWNRMYGILLVNASPVIEGNTITGHYYGVHLSGSSAPVITNNSFLDNDRAIYLPGVVPATISGNTVTGSSGDNAGIYVHGTLAADATLVSNAGMPYVFNGVTVSAGKTLTIQPGTIVKFENSGSKLTVNGTLIAQGTPDQRIIFTSYKDDSHGGDTNSDGTSTTPGQQNWDGIYFMPTSTGSVMDYCVVKYAGSDNSISQKEAGIYCEGSSPTISHCEIKWNRMYGILLVNSSPVIEGNTITGHYYGVHLSGSSAPVITNNSFLDNDRAIYLPGVVPATISGNTVTGSSGDNAGIYVHGTLAADATLVSNAGMPYVFNGVTVSAGKTLTIQPGTIVKFENSGSKLTVNGTLIAQGTPDQRIIFTSYKDDSHGGDTNSDGTSTTPGQQNWDGIYFMPTSTGSVMDYCVVKYAGSDNSISQKEAGIYCEGSSPTISHCEIKWNRMYGILLVNSSPVIEGNTITGHYYGVHLSGSSAPVITNNSFLDNDRAIYLPGVVPATISGNTVTGSSGDNAGIYVHGTLAADATLVSNAGMPYVFNGVTVSAGKTLTIQPGTIVKFENSGSKLTVNGTLIAQGTPDQRIIFTSYKDDSHGGDTNSDGTSTTPGQQNWDGIYFMPTSTGSVMDYCVVKYAGSDNSISQKEAGIYCEGSSPTISHCEIKWNRMYGILLVNSSPVIEGNTITGHYYGVHLSGTGSPIITYNLLAGNSSYGIFNATSSNVIDADYNWWGAANGPLDSSDDRSTGGWYNPAGTGARVSNYVNYTPWVADLNDKDVDGLPDDWEISQFSNITTANATSDYDSDGLSDLDEHNSGTDPKNRDSDADGMADGWEKQHNLNPLQNDALVDSDNDGFSNLREYLSGSDPQNDNDKPSILADFEGDNDVDGKDLSFFLQEFGRTDCDSSPDRCGFDLDTDGDVDEIDLRLLIEDYGRSVN